MTFKTLDGKPFDMPSPGVTTGHDVGVFHHRNRKDVNRGQYVGTHPQSEPGGDPRDTIIRGDGNPAAPEGTIEIGGRRMRLKTAEAMGLIKLNPQTGEVDL